MIETDVCIVGAGPAGIAAALSLAKKGVHCTLLEKASFPRDKIGGDTMPGNVIRALNSIDPQIVRTFARKPEVTTIDGHLVYAPNYKYCKLEYRKLRDTQADAPAYAARRVDFDSHLADFVKKNELVNLVENYPVDHFKDWGNIAVISSKTHPEKVTAKIALFANGPNSFMAKRREDMRLGDSPHFGFGLRAYYRNVQLEHGHTVAEFFMTKELAPGGIYLSPLPNGAVNVTVLVSGAWMKKHGSDYKARVEHIVNNHHILRRRFEGAEAEGPFSGHSIPLGTTRRPLSGERYLLLGDAAGLTDAFTGHGTGHAILSGIYAADFACKALLAEDFSAHALSAYDRHVYAKLEDHLRFGKTVMTLYRYPALYKLYEQAFNLVVDKAVYRRTINAFMYETQIARKMKQPAFYYDLFFGKKYDSAEF